MNNDYCNHCEEYIRPVEVNMTDRYDGYDIICPLCSQSHGLERIVKDDRTNQRTTQCSSKVKPNKRTLR